MHNADISIIGSVCTISILFLAVLFRYLSFFPTSYISNCIAKIVIYHSKEIVKIIYKQLQHA
jgi:hypothetical protein